MKQTALELSAPRPSAPSQPSGNPVPLPLPPRRDRGREGGARVLVFGLLASLLIHLVLLAVLGLIEVRVALVPVPGRAPVATEQFGMRILNLQPVPDELAPRPEEPATLPSTPVRPTPAAPTAPTQAETPPSPGERAPARALSPAERIRVPMDARLWRNPADMPTPAPAPAAAARERVEERLQAFNDSMAAEADRARKATDWTTTDSKGRKWGISPGKIHLGGITLPLPIGFGSTAVGPAALEAARRAKQDAEIQDQAVRRGLDDDFKARVKAIRERKEKERKATGKSGSH